MRGIVPEAAALITPNTFVISQGSAEATTAPEADEQALHAEALRALSSGSRSATNARNGSMLTLMDASRIQSSPAAIQSVVEFGIRTSAAELRRAPIRKYGRRRPRRPQVRSLMCPITGWTRRPVSGAASHRIGIWSARAPRYS